MPTFLGLDLGEKRIGLAVSDEMGMIANPLKTLEPKTKKDLIHELQQVIDEYQVGTVVVGLPKTLAGEMDRAAQSAIDRVEWLKSQIECEWVLWDERLTTAEAEKVLLEADVNRAKRKEVIDQLAAQRILQSYLDCRGGPACPPELDTK